MMELNLRLLYSLYENRDIYEIVSGKKLPPEKYLEYDNSKKDSNKDYTCSFESLLINDGNINIDINFYWSAGKFHHYSEIEMSDSISEIEYYVSGVNRGFSVYIPLSLVKELYNDYILNRKDMIELVLIYGRDIMIIETIDLSIVAFLNDYFDIHY